MTAERSRRRRLIAGCMLAAAASLGLMAFAGCYARLPALSEPLVYWLVSSLTILMGLGATLAVFSLRRD